MLEALAYGVLLLPVAVVATLVVLIMSWGPLRGPIATRVHRIARIAIVVEAVLVIAALVWISQDPAFGFTPYPGANDDGGERPRQPMVR